MYGVLASLILLALVSLCPAAHANNAPTVSLDAYPLLGTGTPAADGWFTVAVRVRNDSANKLEGRLELVAEMPYASDTRRALTHAQFALAAHEEALLELPTHGFYAVPPALKLRVFAASGERLSETDVSDPAGAAPFLFDTHVPSRLTPVLRARGVPVQLGPSTGRMDFPLLALSGPRVHPTSGQLLLPQTAIGYGPATVVLMPSATLVRLSAAEADALSSWVLSGGTLALSISKPEDLRHATVKALVGGEPTTSAVPEPLREERPFLVPADPSAPQREPASGIPGFSKLERQVLGPSASTRSELSFYKGGNLRIAPWGALANYGLGEVHVLAFDPSREAFVSDPWVQFSLIDLVRHAWQRDRHVAMPPGRVALNEPTLDPVRRTLDPNERARWTIALSALILLLYAVIAGPINFYLASRKGRPLRALFTLPVYAGVTMALIITIGVVGRGLHGRSRRLTVIEAGAGMTRASSVQFRGFFAASTDDLTIRTSDRRSVLDVAGELGDTRGQLNLDGTGLRLENLQAKPWQTVVVREDGFTGLGGGVSIVDGAQGVDVVNRTAHDLVGVVLKLPGEPARYFDRIKDGQRVSTKQGEPLSSQIGEPVSPGTPSPLNAHLFSSKIDDQFKGTGEAWLAIERVVRSETDWWPVDVPVLVAELENAKSSATDSGLRVEEERVLLRVVGYGGVL